MGLDKWLKPEDDANKKIKKKNLLFKLKKVKMKILKKKFLENKRLS